jgi:hypothetical protein
VFRIRAAASLPQALLAARPWQTIVSFQAVIAENEACHGEVMSPHLYEIPITSALLPSRKLMRLVAGKHRSHAARNDSGEKHFALLTPVNAHR